MESGTLLASLIWGTVGMGFVIYGKKQGAYVPLFAGLALIAISYFIPSPTGMSVVAVGIIAAAWWLGKSVG